MPADLLQSPAGSDTVSFPADFGTRFMLVVDTEEEFDWDAPFSSDNHSVTTASALQKAQVFFANAGVRPLYVVDYPAINNPLLGAMLAEWVRAGEADIGAHCHPWVNPPHIEQVNYRNSFAGNLPEELERAKITLLRDKITEVIHSAPLAFRAGRYGVGRNTARILQDLGFCVDSSVRSRFDYSAQGGPDFTNMPVHPYYFGPERRMVELPLSTAWVGAARGIAHHVQPILHHSRLASGLMARSGLLQRIPLTPEGVSAAEAIMAIDRLMSDGLRLLMFSFHAPTLKPGETPYVRNEKDLERFYHWWEIILDHLSRRHILPAGLADVLRATGLMQSGA